jgi:hypothetical protein
MVLTVAPADCELIAWFHPAAEVVSWRHQATVVVLRGEPGIQTGPVGASDKRADEGCCRPTRAIVGGCPS